MAQRKRGGGGGLSRRTALALIGGGGLLGIGGTGAFDQVKSNRRSTVSTVEDNSALLKLEGFDKDEVKEPHTITVTNQFSGKLSGDISIKGDSFEFKSETPTGIEIKPGQEYEFKIVTPSYNGEPGSGNPGNGNGNGPPSGNPGNGNGPPCAGEVPGEAEGLPKCGGTDTIIFDFSGPENTVVVEREITVSS